jgi:hypothetical protein
MVHAQWKVLRHGDIETLNERLRVVEGEVPGIPLRRVMSVVRLDDGGLLVHGAIALNPAVMAELEAWGPLKILLVPNRWHRIDAPMYKARYPEIKVYCPKGADKRVRKVVAVDGHYQDLPPLAALKIGYLDGVAEREGYLELSSSDGVTLIFNDLVFNQAHLPGFKGRVFRLIRSTGGPRVTNLARLALVKDRRALKEHFLRLAETPRLVRLVIMHGARVDENPSGVLREVAATL